MSNTKGTTAINSPQGGGALSGLGEKFSPDLFTGTGNFSVPIAVPPGRNGFQPELTIGYSTGSGNGIFGSGWSLGIPGVTRKTSKGIPVYDDKSDIFILSGSEDLVPVKIESETVGGITSEKTYYRPRTEGLFARIIRHKKSNGEHYWEVRSKDGLISYYGTPGANNNDPRVLANPEKRDSIFAWCLHKTVDPFGNEIVYTYDRELVSSGNRIYDQLYVSQIDYTKYPVPGTTPVEYKYLCQVKFFYESRPDAFSAYRQGFEVRTTKRCSHIELWTDAQAPIKTKTYHFEYNNDSLNGISLLKSVSVEGHNGSESEFMPPLEFKYSNFNPQKRDLRPIEGQLPSVSLAEPGFELVDLDGNGLPDILQLNGVSRRWPNLGNGKFGSPLSLDIAPSIQLGMPGVQLIDADGDGKSDLLVNDGVKAGYFPGRFRTVWDNKSFRPYPQIPSFSFEDPEVKLIDLDGDGVTDVLRNGSTFECFFNDPEKGFYKTRFTPKTFADFSFADPRIRFADMTGDGLQDIVFISSGKVQYWPNLGYGRFGDKITMRNAPRFPEEYNPAQILLGDLDGDGMTDIAFVEDNRVTLYVNQSGNSFSDPTIIRGTPRIRSLNAIRITDILGVGQAGILWSYGAGEYTAGQMFFLDFTAGNKPYLLEEINNNMGNLTRMKYGSSVYHYLRDEAIPETRWKTDLPFPVLVVNKKEVIDLLSGGKMVTEYIYHHGYWDGGEREFRGFGRVDVRDSETFERYNTQDLLSGNFTEVALEHYTPPTETRSWFYLGPVGDGYGKWFEPDFSHEYWLGDMPIFQRPQDMENLLESIPRRARRDALRTLRSTVLRSESYALDNTPLQSRPYAVTESMMNLRLVFKPSDNPELIEGWAESSGGNSSGKGYIFFPFAVSQRSTQWERGNDPMHTFSFVDGYDSYGQPMGQMTIAIPRGVNPLYGGQGEYLSTYSISEYIYVDAINQYMVNRTKRSVSYDASQSANGISVFELRNIVFEAYGSMPNSSSVIGSSVNYYDGDAFVGLPYGEIGNYGAQVRSEKLIITDAIIDDIYAGQIPECFKVMPDWSDANGYPTSFETMLQNNDERLGYKDRRTGYPSHIAGWYAEGDRIKYDFQELSVQFQVGAILAIKNTFDKSATIQYDNYILYPILTTDALGLQVQAEYDYRVMQAYKVTDANLNISEFDFSPLGLLRATAIIGKGTEGDYISSTGGFYDRYVPSSVLEYDFFAFINTGNPIWTQTTKRERHITDPGDIGATIVTREYSDGFGRLLQTRVQAEDVIFGDQYFGGSGLPVSQTAINAPAVGIERDPLSELNVVVSGWQIYNNKGSVVEKYEPFFSQGFDYTLPQTLGVKIKIYYDARGKAIRTVNPDNTEQRVILGRPNNLAIPDVFIPTPWESYMYDSNDLAPLTHPTDNSVDPSHYFTPKSELYDALERCIKTTEHIDTNAALTDNIVMSYTYDTRGNLTKVVDSYERLVFKYQYDLRTPGENEKLAPLSVEHIDSGRSYSVYNSIGQAIEMTDAKGSWALNAYDAGLRTIRLWAKDNTGEPTTLRQILIYGDQSDLVNPSNTNHNGKLYKHYDEAGLTKISQYDFKGNGLKSIRQCISDAELLSVFSPPPVNWTISCYRVDWTDLPAILDTKEFVADMEYDALGRIVKVTYPEDVSNERKVGVPIYNKGGKLQKLTLDGVEYIKHIAYNARGQRLMVAYGNTIMTRYAYDLKNSRLLRLKSEKYTQTDFEFIPVSGTRQDYVYEYDLSGHIITLKDRSPECGVGGTDSLDRKFTHDPIYRLLTANGRETERLETYPWDETYRPHDASLSVSYSQSYSYDKMGNILSLIHYSDGVHNFTRTFNYGGTNNKLNSINVGGDTYDYSYDATGNQLTETTTRHSEWDFSGNIRCYYNQAGASQPTVYALYLYDASGNRVKKLVRTSGGNYESTSYIGGSFEYKTDGSDEQSTLQLMDNRTRVVSIRIGDDFGDTSPAKKYNLEDHLGTSVLELNEYGSKKRREEYYPFGETSFGSYAKKRYRYCAKEKDGESGLYYYGARYYSSWSCRFISIDPLADKYAQLSPYNYASNGPIDGIDVDGMQREGQDTSKASQYIGSTYVGDISSLIRPEQKKIDWLHPTSKPKTIEISPELYEILQKQASMRRYPERQTYIGMPQPEWKYWPKPKPLWMLPITLINGLVDAATVVGGAGVNYQRGAGAGPTIYGPKNYIEPVTMVEPIGFELVESRLKEPELVKPNPVDVPYSPKIPKQIVNRNSRFTLPSPELGNTKIGIGGDVAIAENLANTITKSGWFDVVVHGTSDGLAMSVNGSRITPNQVYQIMLSYGYKPGTNIRLLACFTGSKSDGAAYQLSQLAKASVEAPTNAMFVGNGLAFERGGLYVERDGFFVIFSLK